MCYIFVVVAVNSGTTAAVLIQALLNALYCHYGNYALYNYYVLFMDYFAIGTRISFTDVIKQHGISTIFAESTDVFQSDFFMWLPAH